MAEHVEELLSAYLDRELNETEHKKVKVHLRHCSECREELKGLEWLKEQMAFTYQNIEAPVGFEYRLAERIEETQQRKDDSRKRALGFIGAFLVAAVLFALAPALSLGAAMTTFVVHISYDLLSIVPFLFSAVPLMLGTVCLVAVLLIILSLWSLRRLLEARSLS